MNKQSVADLVHEVKVKTETVALCAPSFEAALNSVVTTGITAGFQPSYTQRELPTEAGKEVGKGGFVWLSNNVLSVVERLPKKCRPSVRSVLLAYAQLSSRRGNARTFPAAAELVARLAGCSVSTVHLADKQLVAARLLTISRQKVQGRDVPRMVTLSEVAAAAPIPFEVVSVDDIPNVRRYRRQQSKSSSDTGVRVAVCKSDTLKKHSIEKTYPNSPSLSLSPPRQRPPQRESWEDCEERLAKEHGMEIDEVRRLRSAHAANLAKLPSGAYQTVKNFTDAFPSLMAKHRKQESKLARYRGVGNPSAYAEPEKDKAAIARAMAERQTWWQRFAANNSEAPKSWRFADEETRKQFMTSNEGASFSALAASHSFNGQRFKFDDETGAINPHRYDNASEESLAAPGIRDRKDLLCDGVGDDW
jgi:hypothetical protein